MKLALAIPVLNEEKSLPLLMAELRPALSGIDCDYEIVFINDGSRDGTADVLDGLAASDDRIKVLNLSRSFGQQAAITAGLDFCDGDAVVIMDADLQDPPSLLPEMVRLYREGYDVVSPRRIAREGESWWKRTTASAFYSLMSRLADADIPQQVGDFRLLSRRAVIALSALREQHRFVRGMIGWLGLKEAFVPFERMSRAAGETNYSTWRMMRLSWTAITSFSALPLRIATIGGLFATATAVVYFIYALYRALIQKAVVQGWTSLVFLQCFFFGVTLVSLGMIGQYIARIYDESKQRPLYILSATRNIDAGSIAARRAVVLPPR
jgi:glycosyltransferase involved in cell wall biosynthesis